MLLVESVIQNVTFTTLSTTLIKGFSRLCHHPEKFAKTLIRRSWTMQIKMTQINSDVKIGKKMCNQSRIKLCYEIGQSANQGSVAISMTSGSMLAWSLLRDHSVCPQDSPSTRLTEAGLD